MSALPHQQTLAIIANVAERYGLTPDDLTGPDRRTRDVAYARHEAMAAIREARRLSLFQIGRIFSGRDHSTVLSGIQRHHARIAWGEVLIFAGRVEQPDLFAWAA